MQATLNQDLDYIITWAKGMGCHDKIDVSALCFALYIKSAK